MKTPACAIVVAAALTLTCGATFAKTVKPPLHGQNWVAVTGKPLAATAGAKIFIQGGNAVDAACAMIAATSTMWDTLSWGGETQALIYNPHTGKVIGVTCTPGQAVQEGEPLLTLEAMKMETVVRAPRAGKASAAPPPNTRSGGGRLTIQVIRVPGAVRVSSSSSSRVFRAEWPLPTTATRRAVPAAHSPTD